LARIGKLMRASPNSGTADRATINVLASLGATGGAYAINPSLALGVPAAMAANRMAGSYLRSGALANRLIEGAAPTQVVPSLAAGYNALLRP
jgi:hypothetical protein